MKVNESIVHLASHGKALDCIPPTQAVLKQQILRAAFTGGHIWGQDQLTESSPIKESPQNWGWKKEDSLWQPLWTTLPEARKACHELIKCACKAMCTRCKCVKEALKCTNLLFMQMQ